MLIFVVMVVFMILPQQRRMKKEKAFENSMKVGVKVITKSGIHGRIAEIGETTIVLETMAGKIKMERSAISMEMSSKLNAEAK